MGLFDRNQQLPSTRGAAGAWWCQVLQESQATPLFFPQPWTLTIMLPLPRVNFIWRSHMRSHSEAPIVTRLLLAFLKPLFSALEWSPVKKEAWPSVRLWAIPCALKYHGLHFMFQSVSWKQLLHPLPRAEILNLVSKTRIQTWMWKERKGGREEDREREREKENLYFH